MRKYDIFISYRREGGYDTAKHLNDLLGFNIQMQQLQEQYLRQLQQQQN